MNQDNPTSNLPTLIVPMDLELLRVGQFDSKYEVLGPTYDFMHLSGPSQPSGQRRPNLTQSVLESGHPFAQGKGALVGIHLHWTLPEALRHAEQDAAPTGRARKGGGFPNTPNRWLITRVLFKPDGACESRRWVVESDRLNNAPPAGLGLIHPSVPVDMATRTQRNQYIGQHFPGDDWCETPGSKRYAPLTALGYGDPTFASFYPNSASVFGFYDDMKGLPVGKNKLAYHVVGWYSPEISSPLSTDSGLGLIKRFCTWQGYEKENVHPHQMLCNSALQEVEWDLRNRYFETLKQQPLSCSIGTSAPEALSVLVATVASTPELEGGLNALQFGQVQASIERPDGADIFANQMHEAGFTSSSGGSLWTILPPKQTDKATQTIASLSEEISRLLDDLCIEQQALDRRRGELTRARRQLYADWYTYQLAIYAPTGDLSAETIFPTLMAQAKQILLESRQVDQKKIQLRENVQHIKQLLPSGYRLESQAAPRFWRAQDPSLMLLGHELETRSLSTPFDYTEGRQLPCRLGDQIVTGVTLPVEEKELHLETQQWLALTASPGLPKELAAPINALAAEAVLFSSEAPSLVRKHLTEQQGETPGFAEAASQLFDEQAQAFLLDATAASFTFRSKLPPQSPKQMGRLWASWLPWQFQYEVSLKQPGADAFGQPALINHLGWNQEHDLRIDNDLVKDAPAWQYRGTGMLAHHGTLQLINTVQTVLSRQPDAPGLADLLEWIGTLPLATQTMSDFGAGLLMISPSGQLPVYDPYQDTDDTLKRRDDIRQIAEAVGRENWFAPLQDNPMNPLRAGALELQRLRIVDRFGRFQDHSACDPDSLEVLICKRLLPETQSDNVLPVASLPVRITRPARLQFRWISAKSDTVQSNSHPSTSPIMGWVVLDNVDGGISFFQANGDSLGTLRCSAGADARVLWQSPPPNARFLDDPGESLRPAHPELTAFVHTLRESGVEGIRRFRIETKAQLHKIQPDSNNADDAIALLLGRPLALVRATLALELKGGPAVDHSWDALRRRIENTISQQNEGIRAVELPVHLGASDHIKDGLVNYWPVANGVTDFNAPHVSAHALAGSPAQRSLVIRAEAEQPVTVTMLIDPRAVVHATTGVLPVKAITLPAAHFTSALSRMKVFLRTGPLLKAAGSRLSLTLPDTTHGKWVWHSANSTTQQLSRDMNNNDQLQPVRQEIIDGWISLQE
ncbi:hypothetical protein [Pseudomonas caspiana]|uniref:Uncharacterized protein n=1 Tax=Pseudomonas caspiana TaxID=1451454 RepID=A0A1Y3NVB1_9PSED|nr:hypothetical protein [Pseudomonas caspiana]OUM71559.1 hypothetical protein AUC60_22465 [Pseudomonas caspiana]